MSAVIIAPHPDDEAFACGGMIALKRSLGSPVTVIFLTEGEASHQACCQAELKEIGRVRREIATQACRHLGLEEGDLSWFGLRDGQIPFPGSPEFWPSADRLSRELAQIGAAEVYAPHPLDGWPDHLAAYQMVKEAQKACGHSSKLYAYPTWMWYSLRLRSLLRLLKEKAEHLDIRAAMEQKRRAIQLYVSRLVPGCGRPYCGNLPPGLVEHFQYPYEIYFSELK